MAVELGTLGGAESRAYDIDEAGRVVGEADTATGERHAFLWEDGQMIDLMPAATRSNRAIAINERRQVLIHVDGEWNEVWLWDGGIARYLGDGRGDALGDGGVVALARRVGPGAGELVIWAGYAEHVVAEAYGVMAQDVTGSGEVLYQTWEHEADDTARTYVYSTSERVQKEVRSPTGLLPRKYGVAMNEHGDVVGVGPGEQPFVWRAGVSEPLPGTENAPLGAGPIKLNAAGDVLLDLAVAENRFLQLVDGVLYPVEDPPDYEMSVDAMSETGRLVGHICQYCAIPGGAVVWERGRLILVHSGYSRAVAVNARGEMVGEIMKGDKFRAVLWRPLCGSEPCP